MNRSPRARRGHRNAAPMRGGIFLKLLALVLLLLCAAGIYLLRQPLLEAAGEWWVRGDPPAHADAILVLGDDNMAGDRARRASELYRAGWAPVVVASGRYLRPKFSVAELIERDLERGGVPAKAIVPFPNHAGHTVAEAIALRDLCRSRGWRRVLVVTSSYHTRRARYIYRKLFLPEIEPFVMVAPDQDYNPAAWWRSRESVKLFFLESVGYPVAMWEIDRLRQPAEEPGRSPSSSSSRAPGLPFRAARGVRVAGRFTPRGSYTIFSSSLCAGS